LCCGGPDSELKQFEEEEKREAAMEMWSARSGVSPCITEKARVALLFIESEDYILNNFRFLG
jgi:hypothetical protein